MYEKVTNQMIVEMTDALQFYDETTFFPWEKKKVMVSLSHGSIRKLEGQNRSQAIELALRTS